LSGKNIGIGFGILLIAGIVARIIVGDISLHVSVKGEELFSLAGFSFTNSVLVTLLADIFVVVVAFAATRNMQIVPRGLQNFMEWVVESLYNLFANINHEYAPKAFSVLATIFLFVIVCNWMGILPGFGSIGYCHEVAAGAHGATAVEEATEEPKSKYWLCPKPSEGHEIELVPYFRAPSADLNFTLAITVWAVVMIEYFGFSALGFGGYLGKFFNFKEGPMGFMVGLLEFISEIARIPAFMFRLFGNIFAGEVLLVVMIFLIPLGWPLPFYAFEVFVGFIQAFVFAVLTMAFIAIAVTPHGGDHGDGHH
jgi:F-type H+-transporting ATPase subunit a